MHRDGRPKLFGEGGMTFHVGQKIVCVEGEWRHPLVHLIPALPRKGGIYHVRAFDPWVEPSSIQGCRYIWLCEITNPPIRGMEVSFAGFCFRPVIERKTDISV